MTRTINKIYDQALALPDAGKESLAERLVAHLESHVDPDIEKAQLDEAKRRRDEIRTGQIKPVDGETTMAKARTIAGV